MALVPFQNPQYEMFNVEKQSTIDGVEMGVLENGVPFLTESGLARMCGIDRKVLNRMASSWIEERTKPRGRYIDGLLMNAGYNEDELFLKSINNGVPVNAYPEPVCMALVEYYAFVAEEKRPQAIMAFRSLAKLSFRAFVYTAVGYNPEQKMLDGWRHFHDRTDLTMDAVPFGYFCVFREIAPMIIPMIRNGIMISDKVVPDISAGKMWSAHWQENNLDEKYGERIKFDHEYPDYYPQSKSNPQPSWAYPNEALAEFRDWLYTNYIASKFPKYILNQSKKGALSNQVVDKILLAFEDKNKAH